MRFLVDECVGPAVARWLQGQGYEAFSVYDEARGMEDGAILQKAWDENWVIITGDKHFGDMVYRGGRGHRGIVHLRLEDERTANKISTLTRLLEAHRDQLSDTYVVVTDRLIRFARERG